MGRLNEYLKNNPGLESELENRSSFKGVCSNCYLSNSSLKLNTVCANCRLIINEGIDSGHREIRRKIPYEDLEKLVRTLVYKEERLSNAVIALLDRVDELEKVTPTTKNFGK